MDPHYEHYGTGQQHQNLLKNGHHNSERNLEWEEYGWSDEDDVMHDSSVNTVSIC